MYLKWLSAYAKRTLVKAHGLEARLLYLEDKWNESRFW